jgi:hypothetical protein
MRQHWVLLKTWNRQIVHGPFSYQPGIKAIDEYYVGLFGTGGPVEIIILREVGKGRSVWRGKVKGRQLEVIDI